MDRRELVRRFVKENRELIFGDSFSETTFKRKKHEYFQERYKKSGHSVIPNKEIAEASLFILIEIGKIQSPDHLNETLDLPFFKKYIKDSRPFVEELRTRGCDGPNLDLTDVGKLEYRKKIIDWAKKKVIEEEVEEIEEAIAEKRAEYDSLPSVLDSHDSDEPEITQNESDEEEQFVPWWKRLHMVADPFPDLDGLKQIYEEYYETVLYKTRIFKKYEYLITQVPEEIFKNAIFFGQYGSGKTTLFEYLNKILWDQKIPSVFLRLFTDQSIDVLMKRFMYDLEREFRTQLGGMVGIPSERVVHDLKGEIIRLLRAYFEFQKPEGIVIFIDDLHKLPEYTKVSLDFLSYLQSFTADIKNAVRGLKMSFIVAGALEWYEPVKSDLRYSGSFSNWELIEDISLNDAFTMLNLRLSPFWPNPELKREVKREFVEREYQFLKEYQISLTYRDFIQRVREKFKHGDFDILSSDPTTFTEETKNGIRLILEEDNTLKSKLEFLTNAIKKNLNLRKAIRQLVHVYLKREIEDTDPDVAENAFYYQKLNSSQLIQKLRKPDRQFVWVVCNDLIERNRLVIKKYSVSLESYLEPLYCEAGPEPVDINEELQLIDQLGDSFENDELKRQFERVKALHMLILLEQRKFKARMSAHELVKLCIESLDTLSRVYFTHIDPIEIVLDPLRQWTRYWSFPSETSQFLSQVREKATYEKRLYPIIHIYRQTFASLLGFISRQAERMKLFPVFSLDLTKTESQKLCSAEEKWMDGKYNRCAETLEALIWERLVTHIENISSILYGSSSNQLSHIPKHLLPKIANEAEEDNLGSPALDYRKLSLSDIGMVIAGEDTISFENWSNVYSHILKSFTEKQVISLFHDIDTLPDFHLAPGPDSEKLRNLLWSATEMLRSMNTAYIDLVTEGVVVSSSERDSLFYISFDSDLKGGLSAFKVDCELYERLVSRITDNLIPLDESKFIEESYACLYRDFIGFLAMSLKGSAEKLCDRRWTLRVSQVKGPNLAVRIEKTSTIEYDTILGNLTKDFIERLKSIERGHDSWHDYESLGVSVMSHCLGDNVFRPPYVQSVTSDGRERRDAVYRLATGANPYWDRIQSQFETIFIVVEFKNLNGSPGRDDVRQLGDYLYRGAKRSVGILCSRDAPSIDALAAREKIWKENQKLIVFLSDIDLEKMLSMTIAEIDSSQFIISKIEEFLHSLTP